jgi:hypothetical protein
MQQRLKGRELLEDLITMGECSVSTVLCGLSVLGLALLNEDYLHYPQVTSSTQILSKEVALYGTELLLSFGALFNSLRFACNSTKTTYKFLTGKYYTTKD